MPFAIHALPTEQIVSKHSAGETTETQASKNTTTKHHAATNAPSEYVPTTQHLSKTCKLQKGATDTFCDFQSVNSYMARCPSSGVQGPNCTISDQKIAPQTPLPEATGRKLKRKPHGCNSLIFKLPKGFHTQAQTNKQIHGHQESQRQKQPKHDMHWAKVFAAKSEFMHAKPKH